MNAYTTADEWFTHCETWADETRALRAVVLAADLTETLKWGQPCYTDRGKNIAMVSRRKGAVEDNPTDLKTVDGEAVGMAALGQYYAQFGKLLLSSTMRLQSPPSAPLGTSDHSACSATSPASSSAASRQTTPRQPSTNMCGGNRGLTVPTVQVTCRPFSPVTQVSMTPQGVAIRCFL